MNNDNYLKIKTNQVDRIVHEKNSPNEDRFHYKEYKVWNVSTLDDLTTVEIRGQVYLVLDKQSDKWIPMSIVTEVQSGNRKADDERYEHLFG